MATRDWFEQLTGFREESYELTQSRLVVDGAHLISSVNQKRYGIGTLTLPTLAALRARTAIPATGPTTVECIAADVAALHSEPEFEDALFQVASQFNLLEMIGPSVRPEDGVARYSGDHTQGPACAVAAGAATIYRNYCVPIDGEVGQTEHRYLDGLAQVGAALSRRLGMPVNDLWEMRNGYALGTVRGFDAINGLLTTADEELKQELRGQLAIGLHHDVEVTRLPGQSPRVSQAFCSALPVAYSPLSSRVWEPLARLVLEAAYEATLLAALDHGSPTVLLTRLGGNAFGNHDTWIDDAIVRALRIVSHTGLDVRLVSYGSVHPSMQNIADSFQP
jgi:hypothetical protein